jgi:hypothetical protein
LYVKIERMVVVEVERVVVEGNVHLGLLGMRIMDVGVGVVDEEVDVAVVVDVEEIATITTTTTTTTMVIIIMTVLPHVNHANVPHPRWNPLPMVMIKTTLPRPWRGHHYSLAICHGKLDGRN